MRFNPKARLDPSQIDDQRGSGGMGGGMGFPFPGGGGGGGGGIRMGGIGGLIIVMLFLLVKCSGGGGGISFPGADSGNQGQSQGQNSDSGGFANCQTGQDANTDEDCLLVGIANSVNGFWAQQFPKETGGAQYQVAQTVPFSDQVQTACGGATSQVGPFYCPNDNRVYLDTTFFPAMLEAQLGGKDSAFTRAYVIAHEYGHHIENLLGDMGKVRTQNGPNSDAVKLELMADCLAGAWTKHATEPDANGQILIEELTDQDITDAIRSAQTVGDDRIQQRTSGRVNPDAWTHGSAQQRENAFRQGLKNGTIASCNLFPN
ncbi:MAG: neutral zinc metallopeptidase [Marmoricola sp.]